MNDYKIKELYEQMEMELIISMQRNLSRHLKEEDEVGFKYPQWQAEKLKELKRYQRENKNIIGGANKGIDKKISEHLQNELEQGSINAIKQYNKATGNNKNPNKLMNKSFFRTNDRKVNALIESINNDLNKANQSALRMINDEYRQIIFKSAFFVANGIKTEKQGTAMAVKEISEKKSTMLACDNVSKSFLAGGLNCIEYKNGRRVNIASYAAMAVRTASLRAHLMGEGNFRKSVGRTLVEVTTHGESCPLCKKWQGKILIDDVYSGGKATDGNYQLLSEAMNQGFLHPNCRDGLTTYYPELEGVSYDEDEGDEFLPDELRDKYNYYDRLGKSWNRRKKGFIDPDNKKEARKNYLACEKKKDDIIQANELNRSLSKEEIYSINKYIGPESYTYNEKLRNNIELTVDETNILNNLDSALSKMPKYKGTLNRSVSINSEDVEYFLKDYKEGKIIEYKAYTSTTKGEIYNPEARVQMIIKCKNGKDISTFNESEQEVLFARNSKFNVIRVDRSDNFYVKIYLEEV